MCLKEGQPDLFLAFKKRDLTRLTTLLETVVFRNVGCSGGMAAGLECGRLPLRHISIQILEQVVEFIAEPNSNYIK